MYDMLVDVTMLGVGTHMQGHVRHHATTARLDGVEQGSPDTILLGPKYSRHDYSATVPLSVIPALAPMPGVRMVAQTAVLMLLLLR